MMTQACGRHIMRRRDAQQPHKQEDQGNEEGMYLDKLPVNEANAL